MSEKPYIGQPATWSPYSDCYPCTVIEVSKSGKAVKVQEDIYKVVSGSGHDGSAKYEYTENPDGRTIEFSLRKNGRWIQKGQKAKGGSRLSLGHKRRYYDPHF